MGINRNIKAYMDDMNIKIKEAKLHMANLTKVFSIMKHFNLRLNSKELHLRHARGIFLRFMASRKGIKPNTDKVKEILYMELQGSLGSCNA